ncbi:hypothetical protein CAY59_20580 [Vibrio campbellii]|nr:hypothetical protein CAY59_20580 [Vibrio campbellii]OPH52725.1 hypothetical protein B4U81_11875 [Vibrio campbellii]
MFFHHIKLWISEACVKMTIDTQQYNLLRVEQEARIFPWSMSGQATIHTKACGHNFQFVKIVLIIIK